MNESEYLRRQLATEREHLRAVLDARHAASVPASAGADYLAWAAPRLLALQDRHLQLLSARLPAQALPPAGRIQADTPPDDAALAALLAACETLEALAAGCYRIEDWRQAAQLRADDILRERQLYAAARA